MSVKPIPEGYHSVTPYLIVDGAAEAIDFYTKVFGACESMRLEMGDSLAHAEIQIGDSIVMLADENREMNFLSPKSIGGTPVSICLYMEDVDTVFQRAIDAGSTQLRPVVDQFYGDRSGTFQDPFGHVWTVATHIEDLTEEELAERMKSMDGS